MPSKLNNKNKGHLKYPLRYSRGVSLVEIILALALFSVIITATFTTQWGIHNLHFDNLKSVISFNTANFHLNKLIDSNDDFSQLEYPMPLMFNGIESWVKDIPFTTCESVLESISTWPTGWRSTSTSAFSFIFADLELAGKYGKDCGGHPRKISLSGLHPAETIELSRLGTSVDIVKNHAHISFRTAVPGDPDLAVVSLEDSPFELHALDSGVGINKIDAVEGYIYAARNSTTTQFAVFDIQAPMNPTLVATSSLPGVAGARPEAVSIFYFDTRVYIGTKRTAGREFHVFDVSEPESPVWLGSREMNHNINDIRVKDGFAFLATSGNVRDLIILDVRDPTNITQISEIDLPGNEDGRTVHVAGRNIYLGRYKSTAPGHRELHIFSYRTTLDESSLELETLGSAQTNGDITGITVMAGSILVSTQNFQAELQVFEFNKNGDLYRASEHDLPNNAYGLDFENEMFAVFAGSKLQLYEP